MIFISTSSIKHDKISNSVLELANNNFKNIELSGGTKYYENFEDDLLELKDKYNLNYRCHNYFPPPKEPFVLNLASLNDDIYDRSFNHLVNSINLSKKLGAEKFGFHAGFFIDVQLNEVGKKIAKRELFDREEAEEKFCKGFDELKKIAGSLKLYIENNVLSSSNFKTYDSQNLFMLTTKDELFSLKKKLDFKLLLDVAHLKVSSKSLGLDFDDQFDAMMQQTDYIHISDNDGLHDTNDMIKKNSNMANSLKKHNLMSKDITLEIYGDLIESHRTYELLMELENE